MVYTTEPVSLRSWDNHTPGKWHHSSLAICSSEQIALVPLSLSLSFPLSFKKSMVTQSGSLSPSLAIWGVQCQLPMSTHLHITSPSPTPAAYRIFPSAPLSLPPTSSTHQEDHSTCPRPTEGREEHRWWGPGVICQSPDNHIAIICLFYSLRGS